MQRVIVFNDRLPQVLWNNDTSLSLQQNITQFAHIPNKTLTFTGHLGSSTKPEARARPWPTRDGLQETSAKLWTQQAIDNEVGARIDVDEQFGGRL